MEEKVFLPGVFFPWAYTRSSTMIDLAQFTVISGAGGRGSVSFRREKFVSRGGPDGGDGGRGGDIVMQADEGITTLAHFRNRRIYKATPGAAGTGNHRHGANGESLLLKVPVGTQVKVVDRDETYDFDVAGMQIVIASGGSGGRGNARFSSSTRQAPGFAEKGLPGQVKDLRLELKLLADVGFVGLPNAGKSTMLRAISNAMPDVADFPFTTLEPVLGVVDMGWDAFVVADLPGLIEGAHTGVGLGHQFLRHVERTRVLVHLLDASSEDPLKDYETIRNELALYDDSLAAKPEIIVLNKIDLPDARDNAERLKNAFGENEVLLVSGATNEGVQAMLNKMGQLLQETAPEPVEASTALPVLRPRARDRLEIIQDGDGYIVSGLRAESAALRLGESGYEALDELQDRLRRMGLAKAMRRVGARPGDRIRIGDVEIEWHG
jgi:GTPase